MKRRLNIKIICLLISLIVLMGGFDLTIASNEVLELSEMETIYNQKFEEFTTGNQLPKEFKVLNEGDWFIAEEDGVKILQRPDEADQRILDFHYVLDRSIGYVFSFKFKGEGTWMRLFADEKAVDHKSENYTFNLGSQWLRKFDEGGSSYTLDEARKLDIINEGEWNEVNIILEAAEIKFYINGEEVAVTDNSDFMKIEKIRFRSARYGALAKIKDIVIRKIN